MTWYRRYKAVFPFEARSQTELSMNPEDMLIVQQKADGTWPSTEKWMEGYNEISGDSGEFPAGAYVEFLDEFIKPNPPPAIHPAPSLPSPRHVTTQEYDTWAENDGGQYEGGGEESEKPRGKKQGDIAPPAPPRRIVGNMQNHIGGQKIQIPPQAPPKPAPRKRPSLDAKEVGSQSVAMSTCRSVSEDQHSWVSVTFRIPVQCSSCKLLVHTLYYSTTTVGHVYGSLGYCST